MIIIFDENQLVEVRWNSNNVKHFTALGYEFTKRGDTFQVFAKELQNSSSSKVKCICDYCGQEFITNYAFYRKNVKRGKLSCKNCKNKKIEDTFMQKYSVKSVGASAICQERAKDTIERLYGSRYAMQTEQGQKHFKKTMKERYGHENPTYCPELVEKARQSMYANGTVLSSKPERKMVEMLKELYGEQNCIPNFPVGNTNLDCLLTIGDIKIDVEYDGIYWHKDRKDYDRKRNHWLISQGYKVIRILGNNRNTLPTLERLKEEVDYVLDNHSLGYIDMNN